MLTGLLILILGAFAKESQTIEVCPASCSHQSISSAVSAARSGDKIIIHSGTYRENHILINFPLEIAADGEVLIDAQDKGHAFVIYKTEGVTLRGLQIKNTGISYTEELSAVRVIESKRCKIEQNQFENSTYGIYLENSEDCEVRDNTFHGNAVDEAGGGNGVHIWYGHSHLIERNFISGHRDGIYLEFSQGTKIQDNSVTQNLRYGLHFMSSSQTEYFRNRFYNNGAGVAVMYSRQIKMHDNEFSNNLGAAAYGLLLKEVHESEIFRNIFDHNTVGIYMEGSNRSKILNNQIINNGWALRIMGDCENNNFELNNFMNNSFDVTTNSDHSWNIFTKNYWSHYEGYDLNRDGIGDVPFRPVSVSSVILERVDSSYILLNSFFFKILDQIERTLPSLIPEPLKDEAPQMRANEFKIIKIGSEL